MKIFQVFTGELNKHGSQVYELQATYMSAFRAVHHCDMLVGEYQSTYGITIESTQGEGYKLWREVGWDIVTVVKLEEIEVIE
jgi:hypothetical protein